MYGYSDLRQHPTPERTNSNVTWARHHEVPALLLGLKRHRHFVVAIVTFNFCKVYFIFSMLVVHTVYFVFSIVAQNLSQIIHMHYPTTFTISSRKRLQLRACINMFTMCWLMYRYNVCTYIYIYTYTCLSLSLTNGWELAPVYLSQMVTGYTLIYYHQVRPTCFDGVWWFISLSKEASTMLNASWQWNQELYGT
jgi:hypothetical protein